MSNHNRKRSIGGRNAPIKRLKVGEFPSDIWWRDDVRSHFADIINQMRDKEKDLKRGK